MYTGRICNGVVVLDDSGVPVADSDPPEAPEGYHYAGSWVEGDGAITRSWELVPDAGTAQEAAVALARIQAASLSDDDALRVMALYDEWAPNVSYSAGTRLMRRGTLYRVLQGHVSQEGWAPEDSPSLFARVLAGQSGEVGEWERPGATNGYAHGSRVTHNGHLWESDFDPEGTLGGNVWEPGTVGSHWVDLGEWPAPGGEE